MPPRRRILILHQAALGDFVLTWPVAMALARVFAQSRVTYVTGADKGRLAEQAIGVEAVDAEAGWHLLHAPGPLPAGPVQDLLDRTQLVVAFAQSADPQWFANLAEATGGAPLIHLSPNPPPGVHVWDHQLAQLPADLPLRQYVQQMQQVIRTQGVGRGGAGDGVVRIHPGSGSAAKNWPAERFAALAERLRGSGRPVEFVLGEVERERMSAADRRRFADVAPVVEPADLPALHRLLRTSAAFVGNDAGPSHLAAVLGVPTVAVFGPHSRPEQWRPVGPNVRVLPFDASPDAVAAAVSGVSSG